VTPEDIAARMDGRISAAGEGRFEALLPSPKVHNHASFLSFLPGGTLACAWFAGTLEGKSDISIHISTLKSGDEQWSEVDQVSDDPDRSEQNPMIFVKPDGGISLFHTAQPSGNQDESVVRSRDLLVGEGISSGEPRDLGLAAGTFIRATIVVRDDGAWLLPLFLCNPRPGARWTGTHDTAAVAVSTDQGASWSVVDVPDSYGCVHMTIVPLEGQKMAAFFRRRQADFVYRTESLDGGLNWSVPQATDVPNNNSSIAAIRLKDGRVVLLCNPISAATSGDRRESLYDELGEDDDRPNAEGGITPIWGVPRAPVTLCISSDGGLSFPLRRDV
jgi:predicted neuraminidase